MKMFLRVRLMGHILIFGNPMEDRWIIHVFVFHWKRISWIKMLKLALSLGG